MESAEKRFDEICETTKSIAEQLVTFNGSKLNDDYYTIDTNITDLLKELDTMPRSPENKVKRRGAIEELQTLADKYDDICKNAPEDMSEGEAQDKLAFIESVSKELTEFMETVSADSNDGLLTLFEKVNDIDDMKHAVVGESKRKLIKDIQKGMLIVANLKNGNEAEIEEFKNDDKVEDSLTVASLIDTKMDSNVLNDNIEDMNPTNPNTDDYEMKAIKEDTNNIQTQQSSDYKDDRGDAKTYILNLKKEILTFFNSLISKRDSQNSKQICAKIHEADAVLKKFEEKHSDMGQNAFLNDHLNYCCRLVMILKIYDHLQQLWNDIHTVGLTFMKYKEMLMIINAHADCLYHLKCKPDTKTEIRAYINETEKLLEKVRIILDHYLNNM